MVSHISEKAHEIAGGIETFGDIWVTARYWPEQNRRVFAADCRRMAERFEKIARDLEGERSYER